MNNKSFILVSVLAVFGAFMALSPASAQPVIDASLIQKGRYSLKSTTAEAVVYTGRALVLALIRSTGPVASLAKIRDTAVTGSSGFSNASLPWIHFQPDTGAHDNPVAFPIVHNTGITLELSSVAANETVTVVYVPLF